MNNNIALGANDSGISRKKFLASSVVAVVAGGLAADKAQGVTTSESACLSASFTGTSDAGGNMVFPHGLGALLPANILAINAFIRLPDGKIRNISVQHVDDASIAIAGGVPNASVKVGVVYSKDGASW
jgi:hypothetical protein